MSNRVPHRQGVIYGPPRPSGDGPGSALVGRLVGLGMVGLAVAVLVGAVVLVNRPPAPTPTRQVGPTATPAPQSPSSAPSGQPTSSPSSPGSPSPAPSASPFVPTVQVGPGFVTFGTQLNRDMTVADPRASFAPGDRIAWSAYLTEAANATDVTARLFKLDAAAPNGERLLSEGGARPNVKDSDHFTRSGIRPGRDLDGPGIYLVRYLKGDVVLAAGYFELYTPLST